MELSGFLVDTVDKTVILLLACCCESVGILWKMVDNVETGFGVVDAGNLVYAQNVLTLIITIGFGVGCGLGLIYLPAIVSVTTYFEKYSSVATGIAVAGSGFGTAIFAPLIAVFIEYFGWRGTLWVLSAVVLNCSIFGALFRPLKASTHQIVPAEPTDAYQRDQNYEMQALPNNQPSTQPFETETSNNFGSCTKRQCYIRSRRWPNGAMAKCWTQHSC